MTAEVFSISARRTAWRSVTWAISWAITAATSLVSLASARRPRVTKMSPDGSAKALTTGEFSTVTRYTWLGVSLAAASFTRTSSRKRSVAGTRYSPPK